MPEFHTLRDVIEILQIDRGRINEWLSRGLIDTEQKIQKGSRIHREYSLIDIYAVAIFKTLLESAKMPREAASDISKLWRRHSISNQLLRGNLFFSHENNKGQIYLDPCFKDDGRISFNIYMSGKITTISVKPVDWDVLFVLNVAKILDAVDSRMKNDGPAKSRYSDNTPTATCTGTVGQIMVVPK
jgi:hypothetical protein